MFPHDHLVPFSSHPFPEGGFPVFSSLSQLEMLQVEKQDDKQSVVAQAPSILHCFVYGCFFFCSVSKRARGIAGFIEGLLPHTSSQALLSFPLLQSILPLLLLYLSLLHLLLHYSWSFLSCSFFSELIKAIMGWLP